MPRKKNQFINRKTATDFRLLLRSHQDKFVDDPSAPQHVLHDISSKRQQKKYGIYFEDDYDYMQHLRPAANASEKDNESDEEMPGGELGACAETVAKDNKKSVENIEVEEDEEEDMGSVVEGSLSKHYDSFDFNLPEELMGYDDPVFEGRVIERVDQVDPDLLEAMDRAEEEVGIRLSDMDEGDEDDDEDEDEDENCEGSSLEDDFVCLAAGGNEEGPEMAGPTGPLLNHFFDTLGGGGADLKLAMYADSEGDSEPGDVAEQLKRDRLAAEREGRGPEDYHSQCLQLQIEKIVEEAVTYDIDEVRSHFSGVSCAMTESMRQAMATDERHRQESVIHRPEETMTEDERNEHISRTLAMITEEVSSASEDDEEDPVQTWVDFDRRCKISSTVDDPRDGFVPVASAVGCTVRLPGSSRPQQRSRQTSEAPDEGSVSSDEDPESKLTPAAYSLSRKKGESAEEKRARKAAVHEAQRERRLVKKQNKKAFKTESSRQAGAGKSSILVRV